MKKDKHIVATENLNERFRVALGIDYDVVDAWPPNFISAKMLADDPEHRIASSTAKNKLEDAVKSGKMIRKRFKVAGSRSIVTGYKLK